MTISENPIIKKYESIQDDSKEAWREGFFEQSSHVRFPNWTDEEVTEALDIFADMLLDKLGDRALDELIVRSIN